MCGLQGRKQVQLDMTLRAIPAGGHEHGQSSTPQVAGESQVPAAQGPSIRERIAALSGRMRRVPNLTHEDSAALQAAFQSEDLSRVQVFADRSFGVIACWDCAKHVESRST